MFTLLAGCNSDSSTETTTTTRSQTTTTTTESTTTTTTSQSSSLQEEASEFFDRFSRDEYEAAVELFSQRFRNGFPAEVPRFSISDPFPSAARALERYKTALTGAHGAIDAVTDITTTNEREIEATLECQLGTQQIRLGFNLDEEVANLGFPAEYSPPAYATPDAFEERPLSFQADGPELEGTVTMPVDRNEPVPGVVLVHGSGPGDRDHTVGPNKILKDLAWGLASTGVAVYRYEKRGHVTDIPAGDRTIDTTVVNDAVAAADQLATVDGVRSDDVFIAGHSLGGILAPRIAASHGDLAGMVLLDARAQPFEEFLPLAMAEIDDAEWPTEREREWFQQRADAAQSDPERVTEETMLEYNQVETAQQLSIPMLVTHTGRGFRDAYRQSLERWRSAISTDRLQSTFYPDLDHYFHPGTRPRVPLEVVIFHDNVAEPAIDRIASWVLQ